MDRCRFNFVLVAWFLAFVNISGQQMGTNCSEPRIRRSWDSYNPTEKALYLQALGIAMEKGYHMKFIQLHTDTLSGNEAHQNCMFIYWHRMMLLGYENMLRSLGPEYQCVTIPYWDHLAATARRATGNCSNLQTCTPYLLDSGGTSVGSIKSLNIYGTSIASSSSTICVNQGPLAQFCGNNTACARCVIRKRSASMAATAYPNEASFASVYQQVFSYNDSASFSNAVERGVHNTIHNALSGVMAYLQAPADPIFYSHHALLDSLQTIYLKCQLGSDNILLSASAKSTDSRWFSICNRRNNGGMYTSSDTITMRALQFDGKTYVNVWEDPNNILYPFFKDLPSKFSDYVDAKDLGKYSYTYAISGGLANMYQNCWASNELTATTTSLLAETKVHKTHSNDSSHLKPIIKGGTSHDEKVKRWSIALFEAARIVGYEDAAARDQMEMVTCQYQEECLGGVEDFSALYKTNFGIQGHTRCFTIVQSLKAGDQVIGIPHWREMTKRFLPCTASKKQGTRVSEFVTALFKVQRS